MFWNRLWKGIGSVLLTTTIAAVLSLPAEATRPLLRLGSQGIDVLEVQALLSLLGFYEGSLDGTYSETTLIAVTRFQQAAGVSQDGILGTTTWNKLLPPISTNSLAPATSSPSQPQVTAPTTSPSFPILRRGVKGEAVFTLQNRLRAIGLLSLPADGVFGEATEKAVKSAQQKYKLDPDGVVGAGTWKAILP